MACLMAFELQSERENGLFHAFRAEEVDAKSRVNNLAKNTENLNPSA